MKSYFICVALLFLVFVDGTLGERCDRDTGPPGVTECFLETPYYSERQCSTCLKNSYIKQRSKGKHQCRDNTATYCYYQCMVELHGIDEGPVYDDCRCNTAAELPQDYAVIFQDPARCYGPDGTDCGWYHDCLHEMFACTGQAEKAISYGERFCNLYTDSDLEFSENALQWVNAVRKCLQFALVPALYLCPKQLTCGDIKTMVFDSQVSCYLDPYESFSVCTLPVIDWLRIFWTIKSSFQPLTFMETLKASVLTAANCAGVFAEELGKRLYSVSVWLWEITQADDELSEDELAHAVILNVSSSIRWRENSTIDWYAFAANTSDCEDSFTTPAPYQLGRELVIQVIALFRLHHIRICIICLFSVVVVHSATLHCITLYTFSTFHQ